MAYKTKSEKRAYRTGLLNGLKRKKKKSSAPKKAVRKKRTSSKRASRHKMVKRRLGGAARNNNPFGMTYEQMIREEEMRKRDLLGDFEYDSRGRIKGSYIDGKFEPD